MPTPVIAHPMRRGPGAALPAICEGSAKMPLPIIDPTTIAVSEARPRPRFTPERRASLGLASTVSDIVVSQLEMAQGRGYRLASLTLGPLPYGQRRLWSLIMSRKSHKAARTNAHRRKQHGPCRRLTLTREAAGCA